MAGVNPQLTKAPEDYFGDLRRVHASGAAAAAALDTVGKGEEP